MGVPIGAHVAPAVAARGGAFEDRLVHCQNFEGRGRGGEGDKGKLKSCVYFLCWLLVANNICRFRFLQ